MTIVAFGKEVSSLAKRLFESTEVLYYCLDKKTSNICKWKEKVQKNTGRRQKVQVTKAAFKGLHRFVFFTAESLPCSEIKGSKVHDFEYYGQRNYVLKCSLEYFAMLSRFHSRRPTHDFGSVTQIAFKYKLTGF